MADVIYCLLMKFTTTLERDEDGVWIAECPSIPGCVSQGVTREEALANVREAIELCLEVRAEQGLPLTIESLIRSAGLTVEEFLKVAGK
jgi:predicted RNase H-like HicB family nuclease